MRRISLLIAFLCLVANARAQQWMSVSPPDAGQYFLTDVDFVGGATGYVIGWAAGRKGIIYKTLDSGNTWTSSSADGNLMYDADFSDPSHGLVVGYEYECKCGVVMKTTDGGGSWEKHTIAEVSGLASLSFVDASNGFALGGTTKLMKTTDAGSTWSAVGTLPGSFARIVFASPTQGYALATGAGGRPSMVYRTTDGGAQWTLLHDASGQRVYSGIYFLSPTVGFISGMQNGMAIYRTTDAGTTWERVLNGPNGEEQLINDLRFFDAKNGFAAGNDGKILRTKDGGATWTLEGSATTSSLAAIDFISRNVWLAAGDFGALVRRIDRSGGQRPTALVDADGLDFGSVGVGSRREASFTIRSGNNAELVVDSIYLAGDAAMLAQLQIIAPEPGALPASLEGEDLLTVTVELAPTGTGAVHGEVIVTTNDPNLPRKRIELTGNAIADAPAVNRASDEMRIAIAPNPASYRLGSIDVILPTTGWLSVSLYDMLGNKVADLYDAPSEGGTHRITFDPARLPAGSYRCVAEAKGERRSQMLQIVR